LNGTASVLDNNNGLQGTIPSQWGNLHYLNTLSLIGNEGLTGTVPEALYALQDPGAMERLDIDNSGLSLVAPATTRTCADGLQLYLPYLYRSHEDDINKVTAVDCSKTVAGTSIPKSIRVYKALTKLLMAETGTTGTLPTELGRLTDLRRLDISQNTAMTGSLPSEWRRMVSLNTLKMSGNPGLVGTLPPQWSGLTSMNYLYLGQNPGLTGSMPSQWTGMSSLRYVGMDQNTALRGSLPKQWASLPALGAVSLREAGLMGTLPSQWGEMSSMIGM
jgi:hypothetical protein